jgi:Transposase IS66 family
MVDWRDARIAELERQLAERDAQLAERDLFGLPRSFGAVIDRQHVRSRALETPFEEAHAYAKRQPVKHADETGWWQKNGRAWLWTVVTPQITVFLVRAKRSSGHHRRAVHRLWSVQ